MYQQQSSASKNPPKTFHETFAEIEAAIVRDREARRRGETLAGIDPDTNQLFATSRDYYSAVARLSEVQVLTRHEGTVFDAHLLRLEALEDEFGLVKAA